MLHGFGTQCAEQRFGFVDQCCQCRCICSVQRLAEFVGAATALEMRATGIEWDFSPTIAVARDRRWGRSYESYSQDPDIVAPLGAALIVLKRASRSTAARGEATELLAKPGIQGRLYRAERRNGEVQAAISGMMQVTTPKS